MKTCKTIKHTITIEYVCNTDGKKYTITIDDPYINQGQYYEDWHYTAITFDCPHCNKSHSFEL